MSPFWKHPVPRVLGLGLLWLTTVGAPNCNSPTVGRGLAPPDGTATIGQSCQASRCHPVLMCSPAQICVSRPALGAACEARQCAAGARCDLNRSTPICVANDAPSRSQGEGDPCVEPGRDDPPACQPGLECLPLPDTGYSCRRPPGLGQTCSWRIDCLAGLSCLNVDVDVGADAGERVCWQLGVQGAFCDASVYRGCRGPLDCVDGTCQTRAVGEPCRGEGACDAGLYCDTGLAGASERCQPTRPAGAPCAAPRVCDPGLFCDRRLEDRDPVCQPRLSVGEACEWTHDCAPDLVCLQQPDGAQTCQTPRRLGEECRGWNDCEAGLSCRRGPEGQRCEAP